MFLFNEVVSVARCVLPHKYQTSLGMLFKLMPLRGTMSFGASRDTGSIYLTPYKA